MANYTTVNNILTEPSGSSLTRNAAHYRIFQLSDKLADLTTGVEALLSWVSACKVRWKILNPSNAVHVSSKAANCTSRQLLLVNFL